MNESRKPENRGGVVVVNSETMGRGDEALGTKLLTNFLRTLVGVHPKPDAIIFYNAAVRLLATDSPHLDALKHLEEAGVDLLACITCLDFYGLESKIGVGTVSNMREICQRLLSAPKVISI